MENFIIIGTRSFNINNEYLKPMAVEMKISIVHAQKKLE